MDNSQEALRHRRDAGALQRRGPLAMLFARIVIAVAAQVMLAAILQLRRSATPWSDTEPWLPVYGTLIDVGCLTLVWRLTKYEGVRLSDLIGFERMRLLRDVLIGFAIIPASLVFIFAGTYAAGWLVYGAPSRPYSFGTLPLPAALYGVLVFPFIWGLTEQLTYNGYLLPRFQVLCGSTGVAVAIVTFVWALQHSFMPLIFDADYMAFRFLSSVPHSLFMTVLYLRVRRIFPLAIAHALLDGASVFTSVLLPSLQILES